MKQVIQKFSFALLMSAALLPASVLAQKTKDKEDKETNTAEQIIITRKGDKDAKLVIEVNGDKITVNGKDVKDAEGVNVYRSRIKDLMAFGGNNRVAFNNDNFRTMFLDNNRPMLGVTTEKVDNGAEVQEVTRSSAAEKIGLKKGDIITKVDDQKIESPDDLSEAVKEHKAGDKVTVTFLRDKKEMKSTAELTKWKGISVMSAPGGNFNINLEDLNANLGRLRSVPGVPMVNGFGQNWSWSGTGGPKLGMSVQDSEDGKGVKVVNVDDDGNAAKGGIKEDDLITAIDGKAVNSADEVAKIVKDSREKTSIKVSFVRNGKTESVDLTIPRRLKTADL